MKFCELTETEFDTFSKEVSCKNFFQSLETLKRYKNNKEELENYTKILYSEARLIEGLPIDNPTEISNLICDIISK